jgi:hypothetical protein
MANPNIVSVATINGVELGWNLTNTLTTTLMTVTAEYVVKVNRIMCTNIHATDAANLNLYITKVNQTPAGVTNFDTSGDFYLAKVISVPANASLVVLDTPIYLNEGDILKGGSSASSTLDLILSYEAIID